MLGDFNDILHNGKKLGSLRRCDSYFKFFSDMLGACDMEELSSQGNCFTWAGRRYDLWIQSRLERVLGNKEWFKQFPVSNQTFLDFRGSDHIPILMKHLSSQEVYRCQFMFYKRFLFKPKLKRKWLELGIILDHQWGFLQRID